MRPDWRAVPVVAAVLLAGAVGAGLYAELLGPFYTVAVSTLGERTGWRVVSVEVRPSKHGPGRALALTADLWPDPSAAQATARIVSEIQIGAVVEGPVVLYSILALWPLPPRGRRWRLLLAGLPALLLLELLTTVPQLMHAMPAIVEMAAGKPDRTTGLDYWSQFLEGGGRLVVESCLAILTAAFAGRPRQR